MATCLACGTSSRSDPEAITIRQVAEETHVIEGAPLLEGARPHWLGTVFGLRMFCRCGWSIAGWIEGENFIGQPSTQEFPSPFLSPESRA